MKCSVVKCSVVKCSVVKCSVVKCSVVKCSVVKCSVVKCSKVVLCNVHLQRSGTSVFAGANLVINAYWHYLEKRVVLCALTCSICVQFSLDYSV